MTFLATYFEVCPTSFHVNLIVSIMQIGARHNLNLLFILKNHEECKKSKRWVHHHLILIRAGALISFILTTGG